MPTRTFILGAGFSVAQGLPLVRGLKERVVEFVRANPHPLDQACLEPGNGGHRRGQFYAGLDTVDPQGTLGFEEVLIALRKRLETANPDDPCYITRNVLQSGCARLLWSIHNSIRAVSPCYGNFATWLHRPGVGKPASVVSFNWDVLVETALTACHLLWSYSISQPGDVPVLKPHGSINWSGYLRTGGVCEYSGWERIAPGSQLSWDRSNPLVDPDQQEVNRDLRYMLFPGDPELPKHDPDLKLIWSDVERAIAEHEVLVFLGYSAPEYDSSAAEFFKRVAAQKRVEVYNPDKDHLSRFEAIFGPSAQLVPQTFEDSPYGRPRVGSQ